MINISFAKIMIFCNIVVYNDKTSFIIAMSMKK